MATVNVTISSPSEGFAWTAVYTTPNLDNQVRTDSVSDITASANSLSFSFTPAQFAYFPTLGYSYVTWRTFNTAEQHAHQGKSIDIWSDDLYNDIVLNTNTWNDLITNSAGKNGGLGYSLNTEKWSIAYDYDVPYAFAYGKGGYILFS